MSNVKYEEKKMMYTFKAELLNKHSELIENKDALFFLQPQFRYYLE